MNYKLSNNEYGLYVHIPFCTSKCRYCAFYSEPVGKYDTQRLMRALFKELFDFGEFGRTGADTRSVRTVYIGGGSPSCLGISMLSGLIGAIKEKFHDIIEFTVECNPGQVSDTMLACLHDQGVNRLSIGAQSFNADELDILGRRHDVKAISDAAQKARKAGFNNISLDLIFAICGSTLATWQNSLEKTIVLNPEHISAYALSLEPGTELSEMVSSGQYAAVDESLDRAMYELAIEMLTQAGYRHYEISNFAKPGYECRHNLGCWENRPYIGIGPAAASSYIDTDNSDFAIRTRNYCDINKYIEAIESGQSPVEERVILSRTEKICETAVLNLRTIYGIDVRKFKNETGRDPVLLFDEAVRSNCEKGLLNIEDGRIFLTKKALPIADSVLCDFAAL